MSFLLKSKPKKGFDYRILLGLVFFLVLLLLSIFFPKFSRSISHNAMRPLWALKEKSVNFTYYIGNFFVWKSTLIKENLKLQEEISVYKLNKIDYDLLLKENEELKESVGRNVSTNRTFSKVLSKPPQSPFDTFVVDVGSALGVAVGNKVYISDSIILGLVFETTENTSIIKMFSSGDQNTESVSSRTGANFVLEGTGGDNFKVVVPKETDILWGDSFLYPGLNDSVMAVVYYVDSNSQSSFKTVHLRMPGNVFQVKSVFIEK